MGRAGFCQIERKDNIRVWRHSEHRIVRPGCRAPAACPRSTPVREGKGDLELAHICAVDFIV